MKIIELAEELKIAGEEVLEKAQSMGIEVTDSSDELSDMDAKAVKNTILRKNAKSETKIARRSKTKKSEGDKKDGEPKVTVKAATIKLPEKKKPAATKKPAAAQGAASDKSPAAKAPVPKAKPPVGAPKISKAKLEERIAKEKAEAEARKDALELKAAEVTEEVASKVAGTAEKIADLAKSIEKKALDKKKEVKEKETAAPVEKKEEPKPEPKKKEEAPRSRIKIIKKAEDIKREEKEAAEKKKAAAKKSAETSAKPARPSRKAAAESDKKDAPDAGKTSTYGKKGKDRDRDKERDKFSRLERGGKKSGKPAPKSLEKQERKKRHQNRPKVEEPEVPEVELEAGTVLINCPITVAGFVEQTKTTLSKAIMTLMKMGVMANQNQNLDEDTVQLLADEMGIKIAIGAVDEEEEYLEEEGIETFEDKEEDLKPRPPIITVMGHVDHGKTSLLDAIRNTNVTAGESGGITQHIGASEVEINGQKIVFLDTPGHEAFTAMRARGAHATDIAVLVVAADDSVKPQTIESISHAKAAGVPIIVAINKMDKPGANPDIVKKDLAEQGILVEDWGGDVISVPVSAKTGEGITNLLEMILLQAEVLELKANPDRMAVGTVLEARLDKAKGPIASLLVLNGTLKSDMSVVAGTCSGKIRLMTNSKGEKLKKAGKRVFVTFQMFLQPATYSML